MAIAPSKLGEFVFQNGFSWPRNHLATLDYDNADTILVQRLREARLIRPAVTDAEVIATFRAVRDEHVAMRYYRFNSPQERVRVFLSQYLTRKGQKWAVPIDSLEIPDDD